MKGEQHSRHSFAWQLYSYQEFSWIQIVYDVFCFCGKPIANQNVAIINVNNRTPKFHRVNRSIFALPQKPVWFVCLERQRKNGVLVEFLFCVCLVVGSHLSCYKHIENVMFDVRKICSSLSALHAFTQNKRM